MPTSSVVDSSFVLTCTDLFRQTRRCATPTLGFHRSHVRWGYLSLPRFSAYICHSTVPILTYRIKVRFPITWGAVERDGLNLSPSIPPSNCQSLHEHSKGTLGASMILPTSLTSAQFSCVTPSVQHHHFCRIVLRRLVALRRWVRRQHRRMSTRALTRHARRMRCDLVASLAWRAQ